MRLTLKNFRCHSSFTFECKENEITLLAGNPEIGKSTVIESIAWVLYGSMQNISHLLAQKNEQTSVTLEIETIAGLGNNIVIYRQNHPNRNTLSIEQPLENTSSSFHEDDVAQGIIDFHFGNKENFKYYSYIEQGAESAILKGSKKERLALIEELSFRDENPKNYIEKIDQKLLTMRGEYKNKQIKLETEKNLLRKNFEQNDIISPDQFLTGEEEKLIALTQEYQNELSKETERKISEDNINRLNLKIRNEGDVDVDPVFLNLSIQQDLSEIDILEDKCKEENNLNEQLHILNKKYADEFQTEEKRIQLTAIIEHLKSEIGILEDCSTSLSDLQAQKAFHEQELNLILQNIANEENTANQNIQKQATLEKEIANANLYINQWQNHLAKIESDLTTSKNNLTIYVNELEKNENNLTILIANRNSITPPNIINIHNLQEQLAKTLHIENEISINIAKAAQLNIPYDNTISTNILTWQNNLDKYKEEQNKLTRAKILMTTFPEIINNLQQIMALPGTGEYVTYNYNVYDLNVITDTKQKLISLQQSFSNLLQQKIMESKKLRCPNCKIILRYEDDKLIAQNNINDEFDIAKLEYEIANLESSLSKISQLLSLIDKVLPLHQQYGDVFNWLGTTLEQLETSNAQYIASIKQVQDYCQLLQGIVYYPKPDYSSDELRSFLEIEKNEADIAKETASIFNLKNNINDCQISIEKNTANYLEINKNIKDMSFNLENMRSALKQDLCKESHESVNILISQRNQKYQEIQTVNSTLARKNSLDEKNLQLSNNLDLLSMLPKGDTTLLKFEISKITSEIEQIRMMNCKNKIYELKNKIEQNRILIKKYENVTILRQELSIYQQNLETLGINSIHSIKQNIDQTTKNIVILKKREELKKWQKLLDDQTEELIGMQVSLAALEELKCLAETVQYQCLTETVQSINAALNELFSRIYDKNIYVELQLFKKIKTTKIIKPQINCKIIYNGMEYPSYKYMCGSEKNRLNLGMMLALNLVSVSPIILLDECISFLDDRLKSKCANAIHELMGKRKTLLMTVHQANYADYNNIVNMDGSHLDDS